MARRQTIIAFFARWRRLLNWLWLLILFPLIGLAGFMVGEGVYFQDRLPSHYYIEAQPVGELDAPSLKAFLTQTPLAALLTEPYVLTYGEKSYPFWPWEIGAIPLVEWTVQKAFQDAAEIPYFTHLWQRVRGERRVLSLNWEVTQQRIRTYLEGFQNNVNAAVRDAKFYVEMDETGKQGVVRIRPEQIGRSLQIKETAEAIYERFHTGRRRMPLYVALTQPKWVRRDLERIPHPARLGIFTTYYGTHDSPNRIHNIHLIASWLDQTVLEPGEVFSLLDKTGKFTPEEGYKEAFVIVKDELVPEYGGGACQIATTLYNAVQLADLDVLSRVNHNIYFSIYPMGRDATIYPPWPDFQFKNSTQYPLFIYATATQKGLTFSLFGEKQDKTVYFTAPKVMYKKKKVKEKQKIGEREIILPNGEVVVEDIFKEVAKLVPTTEFSTEVKRIVEQGGRVVEQETIRSKYIAHGDKDPIKKRRPEPR